MPPVSNPRARIFDLGPQRPAELDTPLDAPPANNPVEAVLFQEEALRRGRLVKQFGQERAAWLAQNGWGPVEMDMLKIDALAAVERDPRRYVVALPAGEKLGARGADKRVIF